MRERYGAADGICGNCPHFIKYQAGNKRLFKCLAYGVTGSVATDWKKSAKACGLITESISGMNTVIEQMKHESHYMDNPIEGQLSIADVYCD